MGGTSFYDLIEHLQAYKTPLIWGMVALPLVSWFGGVLIKKISPKTAANFLSIPVYLAVLPGICTSVALGYLMFFSRTNILKEVDVLLVGGPIICMVATLFAISRVLCFDRIPGFDRLSGLMITVGVAFGAALFISKLRFFVGFFASFTTLIGLFLVLFAVLMMGLSKLKG